MELKQFTELYNRIQFEPSILLLGQNYLSLGGEEDIIWKTLCKEVFPNIGLSEETVDYPFLWEKVVKQKEDAENVIEKIAEAGRISHQQRSVATFMSWRWSLLYTSALDDMWGMTSTQGYSLVPHDERNGKTMYLNKEKRWGVSLCGNRDNIPPVLCDKIAKKVFDKQIATKISWISNSFFEYYGVLVIDGLDLEHDWINDENLFGQLFELQPQSVYWFSAPEHLGENASLLAEKGILVTDRQGLFDNISIHMPELIGEEHEYLLEDGDDVLYTSLSLYLGEKSDRTLQTVRIRRSDISGITGENLCLIDNDILSGAYVDERTRNQRFADFLTQSGIPSWHLFMKRNGEIPFYISRDVEQELLDKVHEALKETGAIRKPIVLSGPSNSGKSMVLANLALTIAQEKKYPVIFIRGDMVQGAEKALDEFINNWFCNPERYGGERPDKTLVVWDGSGLKRTERDYELLQKRLFNRNVQVVGSVYVSTNEAITLKQDLFPHEEKRLYQVIGSLQGNYSERFDEIKRQRKSAKMFENSSLLYLLQALFKYEFDAEYRSLAEVLERQFKKEKEYAERDTGKSLVQYVEEFFEVQKIRARDGVASSFQEKLQLIKAQMIQEQEETGEETFFEEKKARVKKLEELSKCISEINAVLAVASEFGVQLPLRLILRFLRDRRGNSYVSFDEEIAKLIQVLRKDTLLEFNYKVYPNLGEEYYVGFRNSIEAENYICLLCDLPLESHTNERKEKEINILMQIIQNAETELELRSVIELARQFGPNGHGMLSELEKMQETKTYTEYKESWLEIAKAMIKKYPEDPEVSLIYAHFVREYILLEEPSCRGWYAELYKGAQTRLEVALNRLKEMGQETSSQYDRLSVEVCANYQQALKEKYDEVVYRSIKKRVRNVFQRRKKKESSDARWEFSSNYMLDILLNAFFEYHKNRVIKEMVSGEDELAEIISDIDVMLNLDDLTYEKHAVLELIKKVKGVYDLIDKDALQTSSFEQKLSEINSDALLYLQARKLWQSDEIELTSDEDQNLTMLAKDRYMVVCRDFPYSKVEIPHELLQQVKKDAERVEAFLESEMDKIRRTKSARCVVMLLRAKWFIKTGEAMLAEQQYVALTRTEWEELKKLCDCYENLCEETTNTLFIPAEFLRGVYEWIYGDIRQAKDYFAKAKTIATDSQAKSLGRLVLCVEGKTIPRIFSVNVQKQEGRKYTAEITGETTSDAKLSDDRVLGRYGMGVSDAVVRYLFDGSMPKEQKQRAKKDGIVRFNLIGAQIGVPQSGGVTHD